MTTEGNVRRPVWLSIGGVLCLALVILLWTAGNFATQAIQARYDRVFLINMLCTASLQFYFIFVWLGDPLNALRHKFTKVEEKGRGNAEGDLLIAKPQERYSLRCHALIAIPFAILYIAGNYCMHFAFQLTDVSAASLMACTSSLFTLLLGRLFNVDQVSALKGVSVLLSIFAVALFNVFDYMEARRMGRVSWTGNALAVISAFLYAAYSVYLKRAVRNPARLSYPLLFAFSGLYAMLSMMPMAAMLNTLGVEQLSWPSIKIAASIALTAIFGTLLPNYLWNAAFMFTSPVAVAIGLSFMTPLSMLVDWASGKSVLQGYRVAATAVMLGGFALINVADVRPDLDSVLF